MMNSNALLTTPYRAINSYVRIVKINPVTSMYNIGKLLEALREWSLHGSANNLQRWANRMHDHIDSEHSAYPLGVWDWDEMEEAWELNYR